jgi:peptidyl-prolyl cis-trans isomerase A (cyclophilin A)
MKISRRAWLAAPWLAALLIAAAPAFAQTTQPPQTAPRVLLDTSEGKIVFELNAEKAPRTVENFLDYVRAGFYNGTIFHRVMPNFMIQGGGFTPLMTEKSTRPPIANESKNGLKNDRGTVAMARKPDPNSATAQFFINVVDNDRLNYPSFDGAGYAVFGRVVEGMDVVDKIKAVETTTHGPNQNVPVKPVLIREAKLVSK